MKTIHSLALSILGVAVSITPAAAQTSLADEKLQADTEKVKADTIKVQADTSKVEADTTKALIDALAGAKTGYGTTTTTTIEQGAEAIFLGNDVLRQAVDALFTRVDTIHKADNSTRDLIFVIGSQPPAVGDWLGFSRAVALLKDNLTDASADWAIVKDAKKPKADAGPGMTLVDPASLTLAITAATTVASLFRSDVSLTGSTLTVDDQQLLSMLDAKFNPTGSTGGESGLRMIRAIPKVQAELDRLHNAYRQARTDQRAYLTRLAEGGGKASELPDAVAAVGAKLTTVVADHDAFVANLYKPVNGVTPASVIEYQANLASGDANPILYVRSRRAALTLETRKNLGTGFGTIPTFGRASITLSYSYAGKLVTSGTITCITARRRITEIADHDKPGSRSMKYQEKHPELCK